MLSKITQEQEEEKQRASVKVEARKIEILAYLEEWKKSALDGNEYWLRVQSVSTSSQPERAFFEALQKTLEKEPFSCRFQTSHGGEEFIIRSAKKRVLTTPICSNPNVRDELPVLPPKTYTKTEIDAKESDMSWKMINVLTMINAQTKVNASASYNTIFALETIAGMSRRLLKQMGPEFTLLAEMQGKTSFFAAVEDEFAGMSDMVFAVPTFNDQVATLKFCESLSSIKTNEVHFLYAIFQQLNAFAHAAIANKT